MALAKCRFLQPILSSSMRQDSAVLMAYLNMPRILSNRQGPHTPLQSQQDSCPGTAKPALSALSRNNSKLPRSESRRAQSTRTLAQEGRPDEVLAAEAAQGLALAHSLSLTQSSLGSGQLCRHSWWLALALRHSLEARMQVGQTMLAFTYACQAKGAAA